MAAAITGTALAGCNSGAPAAPSKPTAGPAARAAAPRPSASLSDLVVHVHWTPKSITVDGKEYAPQPKREGYVSFRAGKKSRVGGHTGCNGFSGRFTVEGDTVEVGIGMRHRKVCDGVRARFDNRFFGVFTGRLAAELSDGAETLTLTKPDGDSLTLTTHRLGVIKVGTDPAAIEQLTGVSWIATSATVRGATTTPPPNSDIGFKLDPDTAAGAELTIGGPHSCNGIRGDAHIVGDTIVVSHVMTTQMACPDRVRFDTQPYDPFSGAPTAKVSDDGETLTLTKENGDTISFTAHRK